jgi:hypothetical protein
MGKWKRRLEKISMGVDNISEAKRHKVRVENLG